MLVGITSLNRCKTVATGSKNVKPLLTVATGFRKYLLVSSGCKNNDSDMLNDETVDNDFR